MNEGSRGFKTALVGGFAREDVLEYITEAARTSGEVRQKLEQQLQTAQEQAEQLKETNHEISQKNAELLERLGELTLQNDMLEKQAEQAQERAAKAEAQQNEMQEELQSLRQERTQLTHKTEQLQKQCMEYNDAKQRLAEIELCAHRRAQEINEHAQYDQRRIRMQAAELITNVKKVILQECDVWRDIIVQAASDAEEQSRRAQSLLNRIDKTADILDDVMMGQLDKDGGEHATMQQALQTLTEVEDNNSTKKEQ